MREEAATLDAKIGQTGEQNGGGRVVDNHDFSIAYLMRSLLPQLRQQAQEQLRERR